MLGFKTKHSITDLERAWVEEGFHRLGRMLGEDRMLHANVVLPTDEFFPDPFETSETGLRTIFRRVSHYMKVNPDKLDVQVIPDNGEMCEMLLESSSDSAGLHFGQSSDHRALIGVNQSQLRDPLRLVAILAHELCHVILFAGGHCWSMSRQGYLPEEIFGYALARFAHFRNESHPRWARYLNTDVSTYYLQSAAWLANNKDELK